jgi:pimeloyl-ACP methyl ester carboxylesterase
MNILLINLIVLLAILLALAALFYLPPKVSVDGLPQGFSEKQITIGKITLNYVEGPDNGPAYLLIPGQMESWQGYKLVMPELAKHYHVYAVDLRGHGKSTRTPGQYSYNICGQDLKGFLKQVVKEPAIVSGLSSGAVLAVWLGAYAPEFVRAVISEDPPMFSSIWPRIREERYMTYTFQTAIDAFTQPQGRNLLYYFSHMGIPKAGQAELMLIPMPVAKALVGWIDLSRKLKPRHPYDMPFVPYEQRVGVKFMLEYDVDFSVATIDGRLSAGFNPEDALKKVHCPMLLMQANWSRDENWGLLGAMDADDVDHIRALVPEARYAKADSGHAIHMGESQWYLDQAQSFLNDVLK